MPEYAGTKNNDTKKYGNEQEKRKKCFTKDRERARDQNIEEDPRPEYNFWKWTKVGCKAANGDKKATKWDDRLSGGTKYER